MANLFARAGAQASSTGDRLVVAATREECSRALSDASPLFGTVVRAVMAAIDAVNEPRSLLRMRDRELDLRDEARIMGILNVTPDSFFDNGRFAGVDRARLRAAEMVDQGAAIIDIGGRSYAHWNTPPGVAEEIRRVVPVVEALVRDGLDAALSIDTVSAEVAEAALAAGAHLINDCSGLADAEMAPTVARYDAALVVMHLKGELNVRTSDAYVYDDVMGEITAYLAERIADARMHGVPDDGLVIDPGLEFGKEPATDCEILDRFEELTVLGRPILFAASRKSFSGFRSSIPGYEARSPIGQLSRASRQSKGGMHTVYVGLGSNLGDRQGNILQALQKLRRECRIEAVSAYYETPPVNVTGPQFLNVAARVSTLLSPEQFERFVRGVEVAIGRQRSLDFQARPIDVDILAYDDLAQDFGRFEVPHPYLADRPYNLVPLAEIAPDLVYVPVGKTMAELAAANPAAGITKKQRAMHFFANRQEEAPDYRLSLNRVGVSSVKRLIRLNVDGQERLYNGEFTMVADLSPDKAGVHMSRFSELLEEATLDVLARSDAPSRVEDLVESIAHEIVGSQRALRADVRLKAEFGLERWTPVSGKRGEETYTLVGIAHADANGTRRVIGVEAEGMTACPCAQLMVREHSLRELTDAGFSLADATRALDALPVATHNQRGRGSLLLGTDREHAHVVRVEDMVEIVENSMSSETYDLLKRPDEFFIVNKAHHNPKFVEDVVRGILARSLDVYGDLPDHTFVSSTQVNYESIHKHDAFAEAFGTFGEFRRELHGQEHVGVKTDLATWLGTRPSPVIA